MNKVLWFILFVGFSFAAMAQDQEEELIYEEVIQKDNEEYYEDEYYEDEYYEDEYYEDEDEYYEAPPAEEIYWDEESGYYEEELELQEFTVQERTFDQPLAEKYDGREFDYTEEPEKEKKVREPSPLMENIAEFFVKYSELMLYIILGIALLLVAFVLINSLTDSNWRLGNFSSKRNPKLETTDLEEENEEDIVDNNFGHLAEKARSEGNYRLAFRYLFLDVLQKLETRNYIQWKKNKTNTEYISEIENANLRQDYSTLVTEFNYIWYGETPVNSSQFQTLQTDISNVVKQIR